MTFTYKDWCSSSLIKKMQVSDTQGVLATNRMPITMQGGIALLAKLKGRDTKRLITQSGSR